MMLRIGTSGYSYPAWRGRFFPAGLPSSRMLSFYAERFPTVEINNTFYRMPERDLLAKWGRQVPPDFVFAVKAPRRITHQKQLLGCRADLRALFKATSVLGPQLGPVLFQLPPFLKKDLARLRRFLSLLPEGCSAAFEFRNASWFDGDVYDALRERNLALCAADTDEQAAELIATSDWGYLRLRRSHYGAAALKTWSRRIRELWPTAYVYFKHEDEANGPRFASELDAFLNRGRRRGGHPGGGQPGPKKITRRRIS